RSKRPVKSVSIMARSLASNVSSWRAASSNSTAIDSRKSRAGCAAGESKRRIKAENMGILVGTFTRVTAFSPSSVAKQARKGTQAHCRGGLPADRGMRRGPQGERYPVARAHADCWPARTADAGAKPRPAGQDRARAGRCRYLETSHRHRRGGGGHAIGGG